MTEPILDLPFTAGIDEAGRDELIQPGSGWSELTNIRQDQRGGADKRLGYDALPLTRLDATSRVRGRRLLAHNGVPTVIDGEFLDSFIETANVSAVRGLSLIH